jgi:hypothetical protein
MLRDGLVLHDKEKIKAQDWVASVRRRAEKEPFGQQLM